MNKVGQVDPNFEKIEEAWSQLSQGVSSCYQVGPFLVRLCFKTPELAKKLTRAFSHVAMDFEKKEPDLTICLWDAIAENRHLPGLNWNWIYQNGYWGNACYPHFFHYFPEICALSAIDVQRDLAFYVVRDSKTLPWWVSGSPLQVILHAWLREKGVQMTHTAAISDGKSGVLLTGKGGSGKSTTTFLAVKNGFFYIGEDYSLLEPRDIPIVYSVYQSAKWERNTRHLFPDCERFIINPEEAKKEKALLYYEDLFPNRIALSAPIRSIVSLRIGKERFSTLRPYDPEPGLKDLMTSTCLQLPFHSLKTLELGRHIASKIPHYQFTLGNEMESNLATLHQLFQ